MYRGLPCGLACDFSWRIFHVHLTRIFFLLLLGVMLYKYQLSSSGPMCHLRHLFLLTLCLDNLCIDVSGVLKSPTIILLLSISPFRFVSICLIYWGAPLLVHIYLQLLYPLGLILWLFYSVLFVSCNCMDFKVSIVWYKYYNPCFLLISFYVEYIFPFSHFQ